MNNELYFDLICLKVVLARSFCLIQGLGLLFFTNNKLYPYFTYLKVFLARSFGSSARLLPFFLMNNELFPFLARLIILSILLILSKKLVPISVHLWFNQNMKTKPFQTHSKPFFPRSNFDFSPKMRIFDKFRITFLCKTKPFFSKFKIKNKGLTAALYHSRLADFFSVDFFSQLIKITNSLLTISPLNDKINQS